MKGDGEIGKVGLHALAHARMELEAERKHVFYLQGQNLAQDTPLPRQSNALIIMMNFMASQFQILAYNQITAKFNPINTEF